MRKITREEARKASRMALEMLKDPVFPKERKTEVRKHLRNMLLGACKREPGFLPPNEVEKILEEAGAHPG